MAIQTYDLIALVLLMTKSPSTGCFLLRFAKSCVMNFLIWSRRRWQVIHKALCLCFCIPLPQSFQRSQFNDSKITLLTLSVGSYIRVYLKHPTLANFLQTMFEEMEPVAIAFRHTLNKYMSSNNNSSSKKIQLGPSQSCVNKIDYAPKNRPPSASGRNC